MLVPGGTRTVASCRGSDVYRAEVNGGLSWSAPYLAGLAALGYQVNPDLTPDEIVRYWKESATPAAFGGKIINPRGFIALARGQGRRE